MLTHSIRRLTGAFLAIQLLLPSCDRAQVLPEGEAPLQFYDILTDEHYTYDRNGNISSSL